MSKNLTRKGLALGAVVALGVSVFAGTPAFAADVNLAPSAGTALATISGETFKLTSSLGSNIPSANAAQLKFKIDSTSAKSVNVGVTGKNVALDGGSATTLNATTSDAFTSTKVTSVLVPQSVTSGPVELTLSTAAADEAAVTVTSWIDTDNSGTINNGESASAPVTVSFVKVANVTSSVAITAPVAGDTSATAKITLNNINTQQINSGHFSAIIKKNSGTAAGADTTEVDATTGVITANFTTGLTVAKGDLLTVQAIYNVGGSPLTTDLIGSPASASAAAQSFAFFASVKGSAANNEVTTVTSGASAYTDAINSPATASVTAATGAITVATNNAFAVTAVVKAAAATPTVVAGQTVYATITSSNALSTSTTTPVTLTVNGTTYTANTALPGQGSVAKLALTSDANGAVTVNFASVGLVDGNTITVAFTSQNISVSTLVTQRDRVFQVLDLGASTDANTDVKTAVAGATTTVNYAVLDQFKVAAPDASYRLAITPGSTGRTTAPTFAYYPVVTGGKVSQAIVDNGTGTGTTTVTAQLQKLGTDGNYATGSLDSDAFVLTVVADATPAAVTVSSPTAGSLALADGSAFAGSFNSLTQAGTAPDVTSGAQTLTGTVATSVASGSVALGGVPVTLTGAGLLFHAGSAWTVGSATVYTANNGTYSVDVYSHTAGKLTVAVATGSASATSTLDSFVAGAAANVSVAAPAASQTGRAVDLVVTVTDKWGNAAAATAVTGSSTGAGSLSSTSVTTVSGVAAFKLIAQLSDSGDAVATFTIGSGSTAVSKSASVAFGATDANIDIVANRVTAVTSYSKGKTVSFYVDGLKKWSKLSASDADLVLNYNLKKGTHTVAVKISGGFVTTEKFIVK